MNERERELGYKVIELFEDFLESELNDSFVDVVFSKRHGFILLIGYVREDNSFNDALAFENATDLFKQLINEYEMACYFKWQQESGREIDEDSLSEEQKNELQMKIDYYTSKWQDICEESKKAKSIQEVNQ